MSCSGAKVEGMGERCWRQDDPLFPEDCVRRCRGIKVPCSAGVCEEFVVNCAEPSSSFLTKSIRYFNLEKLPPTLFGLELSGGGGAKPLFAANTSSLAVYSLGRKLTASETLDFIEFIRTSSSKVKPLFSNPFLHVEVVPVRYPVVWEQYNIELNTLAEVKTIHSGWECSDNVQGWLWSHEGCRRLLPLGCEAEMPEEEVGMFMRGANRNVTTVGELCGRSCGTCRSWMIPSTAPMSPSCEAGDVARCAAHLNSQYACTNSVGTSPSGICYAVWYCPSLSQSDCPGGSCWRTLHSSCTQHGYFEGKQQNTDFAYCVDSAGTAWEGTYVALDRQSELTCSKRPVCRGEDCKGRNSISEYDSPVLYRFTTTELRFPGLGVGEAKRLREGLLGISSAAFVLETDWSRSREQVLSVSPSLPVLRERLAEGGALDARLSAAVLSVQAERETHAYLKANASNVTYTTKAISAWWLTDIQHPVLIRTVVAEIPGKIRVTITKSEMSDAEVHVEFLNGFEKEQPPGGYYWGVYHPRVDGKCPIPDDAVFDPNSKGRDQYCYEGDSMKRVEHCRPGDMTNKYGKLQQNATFQDEVLSLSGRSSVLGKVVVLRGNGVHCALIVPQTEAGEGVALVADFSHETTQTSGVELSGSVNIWQRGPWEDTLIGVSLRAGEELRDVSFHISSKRLEEYPEGCTVGYYAERDIYDPLSVVSVEYAEGEGRGRVSIDECASDDLHQFDIFNCPLGDLTPHMQSARHIVTNASNPANSDDAPVVYDYTVAHPFMYDSETPPFSDAQMLVIVHNRKAIACAPFRLQERSFADLKNDDDDSHWVYIKVCAGVIGGFILLALGYACGRRPCSLCKGTEDVEDATHDDS